MRKRRILSLLLAVAVTVTMLVAVPLTASAAAVNPPNVKTYSSTQVFNFDQEAKGEINNSSDQNEDMTELKNGLIYCPGSNAANADGKENTKAAASSIIDANEAGYTYAYSGANGDSGKSCLVFKAGADGQITLKYKTTATNKSENVRVTAGSKVNNHNTTTANTMTTTPAYIVHKDDMVYISCRNSGTTIYEIKYEVIPIITIPETIGIAPESSDTLTAETINMTEEEEAKIEWTIEPADTVATVTSPGKSTTVQATGQKDATATIKASYTKGGTKYESNECKLTITDPFKVVKVNADPGVSKVTFTGENPENVVTITYDKGGVDGNKILDEYGSPKEVQLKYDTYTVTSEVISQYYTNGGVDKESIIINDGSNDVSVKASATEITGNGAKMTEGNIIQYMNGSGNSTKKITWDLQPTKDVTFNDYISLENKESTKIYADEDETVWINVDTTSGKFNTIESTNKWAQVREGTKFEIPVLPQSIVTFSTYPSNGTLTINGKPGLKTYTYDGLEPATITAVAESTLSYVDKIEIESHEYHKTSMPNYPDWKPGVSGGALGYATEDTYMEKEKAVLINDKNIYTEFEPVSSGVFAFDTDLYIDTSVTGNLLRVNLEGESSTPSQAQQGEKSLIAEIINITGGTINIGPGYNGTSWIKYSGDGAEFANGWAHLQVIANYANRETNGFITVTLTDSAGKAYTKSIGANAGSDTKINKVRLVKRNEDPYFANMEITTNSGFGTTESDCAYYREGDAPDGVKTGVIRFLQQYENADGVTSYGFYFVGSDKGEIVEGRQYLSSETPLSAKGYYGDVTNIAENHFGEDIYAMPFVTINGAGTIYGKITSGQVTDTPENWIKQAEVQ